MRQLFRIDVDRLLLDLYRSCCHLGVTIFAWQVHPFRVAALWSMEQTVFTLTFIRGLSVVVVCFDSHWLATQRVDLDFRKTGRHMLLDRRLANLLHVLLGNHFNNFFRVHGHSALVNQLLDLSVTASELYGRPWMFVLRNACPLQTSFPTLDRLHTCFVASSRLPSFWRSCNRWSFCVRDAFFMLILLDNFTQVVALLIFFSTLFNLLVT